MIYDVTPRHVQRRTPTDAIQSVLTQAVLDHGFPANDAGNRYDSDGLVAGPGLIERLQSRADSRMLSGLTSRNGWRPGPGFRALLDRGRRADAFDVGAGGFPRDFDFLRSEILQEVRQPLTADMLFATDSRVPLGAKTHSARRAIGAGEAQIYSGGRDIPVVGHTYVTESFGIAYVVSSVQTNFIELLTTDFAGLDSYTQDLQLAYRAVQERMDEIAWFGDTGANLYGVLNYPSVAKVVISTAFTTSSTVEQIALAMSDFLNTPMIGSGGAFYPDRLVVSQKIWSIITAPRYIAGAPSMTIAQQLLAANGGSLLSIDRSPRLSGAGPGGTDAMVAYRRDPMTLAQVVVQAPTTLPVWKSSPMDEQTVVMGATGGMTSFDSGNVMIGYVTVA